MKHLLAFGLLTSVLCAQQISPPISQYRSDNKIIGMFELQNPNEYDMMVILATKSFKVDEKGMVQYRPLDKDVQIKMGANSFIIHGREKHMVFYKATFPTSPNSFAIVSTMTKSEKTEGIRINFIFPHMVYVYQKEKLTQADITAKMIDGVLFIHNSSHKLGRVHSVEASRQELGGFPIYPDQTRQLEIKDTRATVKFEDGFKVDAQ